jgi:hypothetical protein
MIGAPYKDAYKKFEITPEGIAKRAKTTIDFWKGMSINNNSKSRCQTHPIAYEESFRAIDLNVLSRLKDRSIYIHKNTIMFFSENT